MTPESSMSLPTWMCRCCAMQSPAVFRASRFKPNRKKTGLF